MSKRKSDVLGGLWWEVEDTTPRFLWEEDPFLSEIFGRGPEGGSIGGEVPPMLAEAPPAEDLGVGSLGTLPCRASAAHDQTWQQSEEDAYSKAVDM
eukprot:6055886-Amphidinium_carterae.1